MDTQEPKPHERKRRAFVLRIAPSRIDRVKEALDADELIIGWSAVPQLLDPALAWNRFRQVIHDGYYSKHTSYRTSGSAAGNMWRFIREMDAHDLVVVPHGSGFYVGEVIGPVCHHPSKVADDTAFRRPVNWLNGKKRIPRRNARVALQSRMKVQNTCADATDLLDEVLALLDTAAKGETPTFDKDLRNRLIEETLKEIRSGRINDYGFESLLANILKTLGAKEVRIVPRSIDKGADIVATFSAANTFEFTLAVQAKHWQPNPPVGKDVVDQLLRGMEAEDADLGWVATSGSFSDEAEQYATLLREQEGRRIELVDGEFLASLIVESGLKAREGSTK